MMRNLRAPLRHAQLLIRGELSQPLHTSSPSLGFGSHASDNDAEVWLWRIDRAQACFGLLCWTSLKPPPDEEPNWNLSQVLHNEKAKNLSGTHKSSMKSHPGWNEKLATDSEVAVSPFTAKPVIY